MSLCQSYLPYSSNKFSEHSVEQFVHFKVFGSYFTSFFEYNSNFTRTLGLDPQNNTYIVVLIAAKASEQENVKDNSRNEDFCSLTKAGHLFSHVLKAGCTCWEPNIHGISCPHVLRVAVFYPKEVVRSPEMGSVLGLSSPSRSSSLTTGGTGTERGISNVLRHCAE